MDGIGHGPLRLQISESRAHSRGFRWGPIVGGRLSLARHRLRCKSRRVRIEKERPWTAANCPPRLIGEYRATCESLRFFAPLESQIGRKKIGHMGAGLCSHQSTTAAATANGRVERESNERRASSDFDNSFADSRQYCDSQILDGQPGNIPKNTDSEGPEQLNKLLMWKNAMGKAAAESSSWSQGRLQASFKTAFQKRNPWIEISDHQQQVLRDEFESITAPKVCMDFNKLQKLQVR